MHPYHIPISLKQDVDRQINELLHLKLIEQSESEWAHPIVCVSKKNGRLLEDSNGRGGKALHGLYDSSWSLPILCYAFRDEERREYLSKSYGKKLTETQTRWATIEHKAYAVIEALKRFDSWIFGAEIELHRPGMMDGILRGGVEVERSTNTCYRGWKIEGALQILVKQIPVVTVEEPAVKLGFSHSTIHRHLRAIGKVSELGHWVSHVNNNKNAALFAG
ncbi:hypothetical protein TNCV_763871 [Trichonephila clavipes]|nr:hypothetical protein TNCV_763871 [Trichonephila clavipes]